MHPYNVMKAFSCHTYRYYLPYLLLLIVENNATTCRHVDDIDRIYIDKPVTLRLLLDF